MQTAHPFEERKTEVSPLLQARPFPIGNHSFGRSNELADHFVTSSTTQGLTSTAGDIYSAPVQPTLPHDSYFLVAKNGPADVFITHKVINLNYSNPFPNGLPYQNYNVSPGFYPNCYNNYVIHTIHHFRHFEIGESDGKSPGDFSGNPYQSFEVQKYYQPQESHNYLPDYVKEESHSTYKDALSRAETDIYRLPINTADQYQRSFLSQQSLPPQSHANFDASQIVELPDVGLNDLKKLLFHYFYTEPELEVKDLPILSEECLCILKVLLTKKLVHDKKKSRVSQRIAYLTNETLPDFLQQHPPLNRKNITKSNIFKKIWRLLENRRRGNFLEFYFGDLAETQPSETFSMKAYRKSHNFNLGDRFYIRCLASPEFRADFIETLQQPEFRANTLYAAHQNFDKSFDSWIIEVQRFLKDESISGSSWFGKKQLRARLPEVKFGVSSHDFNLSLELFGRLARRATE